MKCSFCGNDIKKGQGLIYVKKDASVLHFCSSKCEKNMIKLRRSPMRTRWTAKFRAAKGKS